MKNTIGIVVIGRNEGERLKRCFSSITKHAKPEAVVYVDSGSTDKSIQLAQSLGFDIIMLDLQPPFSAGRARNEGFNYLTKKHQHLDFIQFLDGDCELCNEWINAASTYLTIHQSCAVVSGILKERFPNDSIYNRLCDFEWDTPLGSVKSCGGIFLIRKNYFQDVKGFNPSIVAGEEPELCFRLREKGWTIYKLNQLMAYHDSAMTRFSQWWNRSVRSGQGFAQGYATHNKGGQYRLHDILRIWFWALFFPCLIIALSFTSLYWILLFLFYPVQLIRISIRINNRLKNWKYSFSYAFFNIIAKWPQLWGQIIYLTKTAFQKQITLIEHK